MRKNVIEIGADGAVIEYEADPAERASRIEEWAAEAASKLAFTPGQAETLAGA